MRQTDKILKTILGIDLFIFDVKFIKMFYFTLDHIYGIMLHFGTIDILLYCELDIKEFV